MQAAARREALRSFLIERRSRLKPEDVGLSSTGRRRVPGLRREEVAQLAGVSVAWYTLFETGSDIRVSPRMLDRVTGALRLATEERLYLFSLAIDEMPTVPRTSIEIAGTVGAEYAELTRFTKRVRAASTLGELGDLATQVLMRLAIAPEVAYFVEADLQSETFTFSSQRSIGDALPVPVERLPFSAVHDAQEVLVRGEMYFEHNLIESRHRLFRERAALFGSGRYISAGVKGPNVDAALGYIETTREPHGERERYVVGLVAEVVSLALSAKH